MSPYLPVLPGVAGADPTLTLALQPASTCCQLQHRRHPATRPPGPPAPVAMQVVPGAVGFAMLAVFTVLLLRYYAARGTHWVYLTAVFISWFMGFFGTLLLPVDVEQTIERDPLDAFEDMWLFVYWCTFLLSWVVLPVLMVRVCVCVCVCVCRGAGAGAGAGGAGGGGGGMCASIRHAGVGAPLPAVAAGVA